MIISIDTRPCLFIAIAGGRYYLSTEVVFQDSGIFQPQRQCNLTIVFLPITLMLLKISIPENNASISRNMIGDMLLYMEDDGWAPIEDGHQTFNLIRGWASLF